MRLIYVEWEDSVAHNGWEDIKDGSEVHICRTLGFLVKETKRGLVIASTVCEEDGQKESNARLTIPKSGILKRKYVKL